MFRLLRGFVYRVCKSGFVFVLLSFRVFSSVEWFCFFCLGFVTAFSLSLALRFSRVSCGLVLVLCQVRVFCFFDLSSDLGLAAISFSAESRPGLCCWLRFSLVLSLVCLSRLSHVSELSRLS